MVFFPPQTWSCFVCFFVLFPLRDVAFVYIFMEACMSRQIWAADFSAERGAGDLVFNEEGSWGTGSQITTSLYNEKNEVRMHTCATLLKHIACRLLSLCVWESYSDRDRKKSVCLPLGISKVVLLLTTYIWMTAAGRKYLSSIGIIHIHIYPRLRFNDSSVAEPSLKHEMLEIQFLSQPDFLPSSLTFSGQVPFL